MLLEEYKEEEVMELFKEDGRKEGRKEGRDNAIKKTIEKLKTKMNLTSEQAMDLLDIPTDERSKYAT